MILETLPTATQLLEQCWSIGQRFVSKTFSSRKKWAISLQVQKDGRKIFTCLEGRDLPGVQHAQDPGLPLSNNLSRVLKSKVYHVSAVSMSKSENISFLHTFYKIWFCVQCTTIQPKLKMLLGCTPIWILWNQAFILGRGFPQPLIPKTKRVITRIDRYHLEWLRTMDYPHRKVKE